MKWIPCSEKLPTNDDWVIVSVLDEVGDTTYRYSDFGWYFDMAKCWIVESEQRTDVVAWMPLPKPYKADRKTEPLDKDINVRSKDEPQRGCDADCNEDCTECAKEWQDWKDQMWTEAVIASKDEPQTNADQHVQHIGSVEPTWTKEEHEAFYTFLWNVINPNEMQDYIGMFETKGEPQTDCAWQNDEHIPTELASTMLKNRFKE